MLEIRMIEGEAAQRIKEKVKANDGYCPCTLSKTDATKCMCEDFRNQKTEGKCHCGLYEKVEVKEEGMRELSIPLSRIEKLVTAIKNTSTEKDPNVSFVVLMTNLFPTCMDNIKKELMLHYNEGFQKGFLEAKNLKNS